MAKAAKPTPSEIEDFYKQNPALFEKRRIYSLAELAIKATPEQMQEVQKVASSGKTMNEIATELKAKNYELQANTHVKPAEQIPAGLLTKLQTMNDGDLVVVNTGRSINIVQVAKSENQPIDLEKAKPIIERYFTNKSKNEIAAKEVEKLNKESKIEYLGDFADMKSGVKPEVAQESKAPAPAAKPDADSKEKKVLEKGISGL